MSAGSIGQQIINGTYGLDNRPPAAYEELKAWCKRNCKEDAYIIFDNAIEIDDTKIMDRSVLYLFDEKGALKSVKINI